MLKNLLAIGLALSPITTNIYNQDITQVINYNYNPNITLAKVGYYGGYIFTDTLIIENFSLDISQDEGTYYIDKISISSKHNVVYSNSSNTSLSNLTSNTTQVGSYTFNLAQPIAADTYYNLSYSWDFSTTYSDFTFTTFKRSDSSSSVNLSISNDITYSGPTIVAYKAQPVSPSISISCNSILSYISYYLDLDFQNGYSNGYETGYNEGKAYVVENPSNYSLKTINQYNSYGSSEYQRGYTAGTAAATTQDLTLTGLISSVFQAPYTMLNNMLNFELFGINILALVKFLLTIGLIIFILSVFKRSKE